MNRLSLEGNKHNDSSMEDQSLESTSLLHCSICFDSYDSSEHQPKLLPCHHTFCKHCLLSLVSNEATICCPTCRERSTVMSPPPYGVSRLQTNFYITQMQEYMQHDVKNKGCRKHDNAKLNLLCLKCEVLICATCSSTDHKDSAGHDVKDLDSAKRETVRFLEVQLATTQQMILDYHQRTKTYETEIISLNAAKGKAIQNVDNAFDKYIELLNRRRQDLKSEVMKEFSERRKALQRDMNLMKMTTSTLNGLVEQVQDSISDGNISDLLAYKSKLTAKNREVRQEGILENCQIKENFIRFASNCNDMEFMEGVQSLGMIKVKDKLPCNVKVIKGKAVASLITKFHLFLTDANGTNLENYPVSVLITDMHDDIIPNMVQYVSQGKYEVTFRPEVAGLHKVEVKFLDQLIHGGTQHLDVLSNNPVAIIGGKDEENKMEYPRSVAVDRMDNLYVVDTGNNRIQKFDKTGKYLSELSISYESEIYTTCGIALDENRGRLICPEVCIQEADLSEARAILVYSLDGGLLERYVYKDLMRRALSIAVDSCSRMVIADYELNTIFIFDQNARLLRKFGQLGTGPGQFQNPTFLCIGENNTIIVSDGNNHRIQVFDHMGTFLRQFGRFGIGKGQFNMPFGVATDFHGNVLVVDGGNKRIQVFKQTGEFLSCIESLGDSMGAPRGIAVTSDGFVLVADRDNHCVKKFKYLHCTAL